MSDHKILARKFVDSLNEGNINHLMAIVHPDYIQHNRYVEPGKQGVEKFFNHFLSAFSELRVEATHVVAEGDLVAGRFIYKGAHTGQFMGAPPTGKSIEMITMDIWQVRDGLLFEHWDEINALELFGQLGLSPGQGG